MSYNRPFNIPALRIALLLLGCTFFPLFQGCATIPQLTLKPPAVSLGPVLNVLTAEDHTDSWNVFDLPGRFDSFPLALASDPLGNLHVLYYKSLGGILSAMDLRHVSLNVHDLAAGSLKAPGRQGTQGQKQGPQTPKHIRITTSETSDGAPLCTEQPGRGPAKRGCPGRGGSADPGRPLH